MLPAQQSMKNGAFEIKEKLSRNKENLLDQVIDCDISWVIAKKRVFIKECILSISIYCLKKFYTFLFFQKAAGHADIGKRKKETPQYEQFLLQHDCPINHESFSLSGISWCCSNI